MRNFPFNGIRLALAALLCGGAAFSQSAPERPNIIYILADDAGIGDFGCYGQKRLKTPNVDRLAAEGMRFRNAYCGSMVCAPSRCALMTGKHPGHGTVRGNWEVYPEGQFPLKPRETGDITVAQVLQQAGYATGGCGKWGLGAPGSGAEPNDKGFDFFFGYNCQRHAHRYYTDYLYRNRERVEVPQSPTKHVYAQDLIANESLNFIRQHRDGPFFLYCAWTLPHGPYRPDQVPSLDAYKNTGWPESQKIYAAMLERLDADVGRLLDLLKELRLEQKTLVVFTSDNGAGGESANNQFFGSTGGLRGAKGALWEGGIRVPMLVRWPGHVPAAAVCDFVTAFWDFLPTAAELARAKTAPQVDGISIVPTLLGQPQTPAAYLYWEEPRPNAVSKAVRLGQWKGYQPASGQPVQLYDLSTDRAEANNVAAEHPEITQKIQAIMTSAHRDIEVPKVDRRIWTKYREENQKLDERLGLSAKKQ